MRCPDRLAGSSPWQRGPRTEAAGRPLILALDDVQYIDSAGMAALETLRRSTELRIIVPRQSVVRRSLEIVGFDQLIPVFERLEDVPA
ncbi:MAG TPA: STAS domain-containing protein [Trebonia sp.]|nr:STAS domain-containing protein [Trebonia sp.]